jgi:hypothetical protein
MAMVLVLGAFAGLFGVIVGGVVGVIGYLGGKKGDMAFRRRWNGVVLASFALAMLCLAPFLLGVRVGG